MEKMVDAIGAALVETVLSFANDRIGEVLGSNAELQRLSKNVKRIRGLLAIADDKKHSLVVQDWLEDLEDLEEWVFKAENALEELNYENLRLVVERSQRKRKWGVAFSFFNTTAFRFTMASKIKDIKANLERINRKANEVGLVSRLQPEDALPVSAPAGAATSRQTDSAVVPNVVGRANDESKIMEMLLSPSDKVVSVIPIFGPPGLGKTTLAKSVYHHSKLSGHFGKKIWVCVAKKIEIEKLFKFILESLTVEKVDLDRRSTIVHKIGQKLGEERYLLVLDDVWDDREWLWNDLFTTLEGLNATKGSWCLATTRLGPVANTMSRHLKMNIGPYKLGSLTDDDCWSIIKRKVIAGEEVPQELEAIKEQILRRCGGLPLAATLIGGLLHKKWEEERRFIVEKSLLNGDQDDVKQTIKVSFDHLSSPSVKNCFVYCSIFPQDTELEKDLLIEHWMAEGFLQPERLMEDIGNKYIRILLQSSLLEEVNKRGGKCYKMHDLVHDFAKSALNEKRYLAWTSSQGTAEDIIKKNSTSLRTLFLESSISADILSKFECLHVLKLFGKDVKVLPDSIGKLKRLRFLDISDSGITKLPESLCELYNLQTLRIKDGKLEEGFPKQTSNLISLRHLHYCTGELFQMPSEMGRLTHLQTLKFFNIGQENGRGIEELGNLKDLKGSLEIRNLELATGKGAEKAKLFEKPNLSMLTYLWGSGDRESNNCDDNILECLEPPQNLQKLEIRNFGGDRFPKWFIKLSALVKLQLIDCKECRELPALGQLPSLERLELRRLENIRSIIGLSFYDISSGGDQVRTFFPALKSLSLVSMVNLKEWMEEDKVKSTTDAAKVVLFPVLEDLDIFECFQLTSAPSPFPNIGKLNIQYGCHLSLLKNIVSSVTNLSAVQLNGNMLELDHSHLDKHIESLYLWEGRHNNNLVRCLYFNNCGSLPSEMPEHLCHLPSFRELRLTKFSNLTRLVGQVCFFKSIKKLKIFDCPELTSIPGKMLESCTSLQKLEIFCCDGLTSLPGEMLKSCDSLQKLKIHGCDGLTSLPGEMLESCTSLQILKVSDCSNLVSFPHDLQKTPSLEILDLSRCPELMIADMLKGFDLLTSKGFDLLTSLKKLKIGPFSSNEEFDWSKLVSSSSSRLTSLRFDGLPHVESLPEQIQNLTSLMKLKLYDFGIEALPDWIGNFASLERLELWDCKKLLYLPSMAVMKHLSKLTHLIVCGSPLLKERCNPQGSEWHKISHIPNLEIY